VLIPSIDLAGGRAVQLRRGKEFILKSERDPRDLAREFARVGEIAVIDLDAAMGKGDNQSLVEELCALVPCRVGGGIRDLDRARRLLRAGARRLIIGTRAEPEFLSQLPRERVMAALDTDRGQVLDHGWKSFTGESPLDRAQRLAPHVSGFLYTLVDLEGTEQGIDLKRIRTLTEATSVPLTAAGGIKAVDEVAALDKLGVDAQVGMSLYKKRFTAADCMVAVLNFDAAGGRVIPTIVQDARDGRVLMFSRSNPETLRESIDKGETILFSRRRGRWRKGEESGNTQRLIRVEVDCDRDTLLFLVEPNGPACHRLTESCFGDRPFSLERLEATIRERQATEDGKSYTRKLLENPALRKEKLIEEAEELAVSPNRENARWEAADLLYHALVEMRAKGVSLAEVVAELESRQGSVGEERGRKKGQKGDG
jgi:phosphoribosyl-ATP pyrophosphohydrolase/phosphoribosyl-AMP cyclohydrolase